jgi:hypothetical protein
VRPSLLHNILPKEIEASAVVVDIEKFKNDLPKSIRSLLPFKLKKKSRVIQVKKEMSLADLIKGGESLLSSFLLLKDNNLLFPSTSPLAKFAKYSNKLDRFVRIFTIEPIGEDGLDQLLHHLKRLLSTWKTKKFSRALYYNNTTLFKRKTTLGIANTLKFISYTLFVLL